MDQFFIHPENIIGSEVVIQEPAQINHMRNVLRMRRGDRVCLICEQEDREYICRLTLLSDEEVRAVIEDICGASGELPVRLVLFQGLPKSDKMDLIIQKAVELGADQIVPVAMKRCVVKLDAKKAAKKQQRWQEIARNAARQSKRARIPQVRPLMDYREALAYASSLDLVLLPYEDAQGMDHARAVFRSVKEKRSAGIFIGPEGGFEKEEVALAEMAGAIPVTLGHRILRTETAGMAVLSILMFMLDED